MNRERGKEKEPRGERAVRGREPATRRRRTTTTTRSREDTHAIRALALNRKINRIIDQSSILIEIFSSIFLLFFKIFFFLIHIKNFPNTESAQLLIHQHKQTTRLSPRNTQTNKTKQKRMIRPCSSMRALFLLLLSVFLAFFDFSSLDDGGMKKNAVLAQETADDNAASSGAIEVTPTEFRAKLAQMSSSEKYFAKFYAPWCGHCKSMAADWDALAKEETEVKLFSVDASVQSEAAVSQEFEIKSFPTIMFFEDGKMFPYSGGARTKDALGTYMRSKAKKDARTFSFKGDSFKLQQPGLHVRAKKYWDESVQVIKQVYKHKPGAAYVLYGAGLLTGVCFASLFFAVTTRGGGKKAASTKTAAAKSKGSAKKTN